MSRIGARTGGHDPERASKATQEQLDANLSLGIPPKPEHTGTPGENGTLAHFRGSFVRQKFIAANTATVFQHNLGVELDPKVVEGRTNVMWHLVYVEHDGTAGAANANVSLLYTRGDPMTKDSISLRCFAVTRLVNADHPIHVILFFMPAE